MEDRSRSVLAAALAFVCTATLSACGDDASARNNTDAGRDAGAARDAGGKPHDAGRDTVMDASHTHDAAPRPRPDASSPHRDAGDDAGNEDAGPAQMTLADTGLYSDFASETLAPGVHAFEPQFFLWSDGAAKKRYFYLPPNTQIDTSTMDAWKFPVGTKAWKEFTRDGVRVETRLLEKTAQGWFMMAFLWNKAQTEAVAAPYGMKNANGTQHDVPASSACHVCHDGMPDRLLGVSAIQLSHNKPGLTITTLQNASLLTNAPSRAFVVPGTQADQDALGALHANCAHCHNPGGAAVDRARGMDLRLLTGSLASVTGTPAYSTTVGVALVSKTVPGATLRIAKNDPSMSGLYLRLTAMRGPVQDDLAMPPLATELADSSTEAKVATWITNFP